MRPVALLIGIESYPHPSAALPGARHDVERMRACSVALGVAESDLRVLSGAVTRHELDQGLAWLVERLAEPGVSGMLHFAGHGRRVPQDWAMVSSEGAQLTMRELRERLSAAPARDLTLLFDACVDSTLDLAALLPQDAVLYLGTDATPEIQLGRTRQGALSWALATVLERWTWEQGGPDANTAVLAAAQLLDALQTGVDLRVSPRIRTAAFLEGRAGARTKPAPPVALRQVEGGDGEGYKIEDDSSNEIGWLWVPAAEVDEIWDVDAFSNVWWLHAPTTKTQGTGNTYDHVTFTGSSSAFPQLGGSAKVYKGVKHNSSGNPVSGEVVFMVLPTGSWPEEPDWYVRNSTTLTNDVIRLGSGESIRFAKLSSPPTGQVIKGT